MSVIVMQPRIYLRMIERSKDILAITRMTWRSPQRRISSHKYSISRQSNELF